jgi:hypothetical protein
MITGEGRGLCGVVSRLFDNSRVRGKRTLSDCLDNVEKNLESSVTEGLTASSTISAIHFLCDNFEINGNCKNTFK